MKHNSLVTNVLFGVNVAIFIDLAIGKCSSYNGSYANFVGETVKVRELFIHPDYYKNKTNRMGYDFCLARVDPMRLNDQVSNTTLQIQAAKLSERHLNPALGLPGESTCDYSCTVAGWGKTGNRKQSRVVLSSMVKVMSASLCQTYTSRITYTSRNNMYQQFTNGEFCAGLINGGNDTCRGDSGGPLYCEIDGIQVLYGVTSRGDQCGRPRKPGIYGRVSAALQWIKTIVPNVIVSPTTTTTRTATTTTSTTTTDWDCANTTTTNYDSTTATTTDYVYIWTSTYGRRSFLTISINYLSSLSEQKKNWRKFKGGKSQKNPVKYNSSYLIVYYIQIIYYYSCMLYV